MLPDPLHPAVVHFPIVLALLLPFVALWALVAIRHTEKTRAVWIPVVVIGALLFGGALLAKETGEDQEERVERVVAERHLEEHEELAERMVIASGVAFALLAAGLLPGVWGVVGRWASVVAAVVALVVVIQVGETGGELVYEHGAASAYVSGSAGGSAGTATVPSRERYEHEEEDDD